MSPRSEDRHRPFTFGAHETLAACLQSYPGLAGLMQDWGWHLAAARDLTVAAAEAEWGPRDARLRLALAATPEPTIEEPDRVGGGLDLEELVELIAHGHHAYTRSELARIACILDAVEVRLSADGGDPLQAAQEDFRAWRQEVERHLAHEERLIFPLVEALARIKEGRTVSHRNVEERIEVLEHDHEDLDAGVIRIRDDLAECTWPTEALAHRDAVLAALSALAEDLAVHTYLEEEYLVPGIAYADELFDSRHQAHTRHASQAFSRQRRDS